MSHARIIKRYANRKLYDTQHSRYVTLDQISEMIRNGDDVKIIDNKTKEDLTSVTLAQIIFEEEKKQRSFLPLQAMRNIIQNGGESFAHLVTEAQRRVTSILPRRKEGEEAREPEGEVGKPLPAEAVAEDAAADAAEDAAEDAASDEPAAGVARKGREGLGSMLELRDWVQQSQRTIDEWHKRVDDRIRHVVEGIYPFTGLQKDVKVLADRIAALEAKLEQLAAHEDADEAEVAGSAVPATIEASVLEPAPSEPVLADVDESEPLGADIVPIDSKAQPG